MPTIKKNQTMNVLGERKGYSIRYEEGNKRYDEKPYFFGVPDDQSGVEGAPGTNKIHPHSKEYLGVKGKNEAEVIEKLEAFFKWEITNGTTREYFILVDCTNSNTRWRGSNGKHWWDEDKTGGSSEITFKFDLAVKVTKGAAMHWYNFDPNKKETLSNKMYPADPKKVSIIPYTEERHAACREIMKKFEELQQNINKLFRTEKEAVLDNTTKLLQLTT